MHTKVGDDLWAVEVDRGQMEQVMLNLFVNAWQAMPGGGDMYLSVENVALGREEVSPYGIDPGRFVKITVTDTGVGMEEATKERIFEPFFSTKQRGRGTGLGLASVYGIIKNHGGFISVESETAVGTSFMVHLPASNKRVEYARQVTEAIQPGKETVLLIDDEEMILDIGTQMLQGLGYKVLTATGGNQGVEIYHRNKGDIDLVILDMIMPDLGGRDTFAALCRSESNVNVLLSSGYSIDGQAAEILAQGCRGFIQKPFTMAELSKKIRQVLGAPFRHVPDR
jgi:CheY-like chemotaxis protein